MQAFSESPLGGGAESGAVGEGYGVVCFPAALPRMLREFAAASPGDRARMAVTWGILPGGPAAEALGVPLTDADTTDGTA